MKGMPRDEAAAVLKLPKWAQSQVIALIRERDAAIAELHAMTAKPVHRTGAVTIKTNSMNDERALADWEHVTFWIDEHRNVEIYHGRFQTYPQEPGEAIEVRTDGPLTIIPQVTNSIKILVEDRRKTRSL